MISGRDGIEIELSQIRILRCVTIFRSVGEKVVVRRGHSIRRSDQHRCVRGLTHKPEAYATRMWGVILAAISNTGADCQLVLPLHNRFKNNGL
jgi:hypothetical protein